MQSYPGIEEGYHGRSSMGNVHQYHTPPTIMIDFITDMSSNRYPSSNEGILTPQDSNSMDDQVRGSLSGAGYPEKSGGSLNEYVEVAQILTMNHHGEMNAFHAGFGTQFDTEGGDGSKRTGQVDGIGTPWNDENGGNYPQRGTELNELWNFMLG